MASRLTGVARGKLTMFMMNSKVALKTVLMMGATAVGMMLASGGARASSGYTYTPISDPLGTRGGGDSSAWGINNAGQVVGSYEDVTTNAYGFLDTNGTFTSITTVLSAGNTQAMGINSAGTIVGYYWDNTYAFHGFVDTNGTLTTLNDPVGCQRLPAGNNSQRHQQRRADCRKLLERHDQ